MKLLTSDGDIIHEDADAKTVAELCTSAARAGKSLYRADLSGANLARADLSGANLARASLSYADLAGASLSYANLAEASLSYADLSGASLSRANLSYANLAGANLAGANLSVITPVIPDIHKRLLAAVTAKGCKLDMKTWHQCETSHCRAGWIVTLAGEGGKILESVLGTGTAAALIYRSSDPKMTKVPNWTASDEDAMAEMVALANGSANGSGK